MRTQKVIMVALAGAVTGAVFVYSILRVYYLVWDI